MSNVRETLMQFPEVTKLIGVPQPEKWHPEGDSFEHTVLVTEQAEKRYPNAPYLWHAAVTHDLGKAYTNPDNWPKHYGHADLGIKPTREFLERVGVPEDVILACELTTKYHMHIHQALEMKARTYAKIMWDIVETAGKMYGIANFDTLSVLGLIDLLARVGVCDHYGRGGVDPDLPCIEACVFHAILKHNANRALYLHFSNSTKDQFINDLTNRINVKTYQSLKLSHPQVNRSMQFLEMELDDTHINTGIV